MAGALSVLGARPDVQVVPAYSARSITSGGELDAAGQREDLVDTHPEFIGNGQRHQIGTLESQRLRQRELAVARHHPEKGGRQQGERGQQLEELEHDPQVLATPQGTLAFGQRVNICAADHHLPARRVVDTVTMFSSVDLPEPDLPDMNTR
jgi:hypothetical protein